MPRRAKPYRASLADGQRDLLFQPTADFSWMDEMVRDIYTPAMIEHERALTREMFARENRYLEGGRRSGRVANRLREAADRLRRRITEHRTGGLMGTEPVVPERTTVGDVPERRADSVLAQSFAGFGDPAAALAPERTTAAHPETTTVRESDNHTRGDGERGTYGAIERSTEPRWAGPQYSDFVRNSAGSLADVDLSRLVGRRVRATRTVTGRLSTRPETQNIRPIDPRFEDHARTLEQLYAWRTQLDAYRYMIAPSVMYFIGDTPPQCVRIDGIGEPEPVARVVPTPGVGSDGPHE